MAEGVRKSFESSKDLDELTKKLQSAPIFLPRIQMQRLAELRSETLRKIDDDQVLRVIVQFEQISDLSKRVECLDRMKALLEREPTI